MKLQDVMARYDIHMQWAGSTVPMIRFRGGEWYIPVEPSGSAFDGFVHQLRQAAWTEQEIIDPVDALVDPGIAPEDAKREWLLRQTVSRQLLIFFGAEIYDALLSAEEVLA